MLAGRIRLNTIIKFNLGPKMEFYCVTNLKNSPLRPKTVKNSQSLTKDCLKILNCL